MVLALATQNDRQGEVLVEMSFKQKTVYVVNGKIMP